MERASTSLGGPGQARRLAEQAPQRLTKEEPSGIALKALNLKQLTAIWALACTRPGFPSVNCHLRVDELAGLG